LLDRLTNRLGRKRVLKPVARQSHLPERAQRLLPLLDDAPRAALEPSESHRPKAQRPPRLLARPEPIEATALMPDDPPRQFSWRGQTHRVRRAEGPERIAPEWWRQEAATRDYYRVEDTDGKRFWVYRDGLYGTEAASPRWYLHGLFA
jgi:protein ImuB